MEPHESQEQLTIDWAAGEKPAREPALPVELVTVTPTAARSPLPLIAIVGAVAGGVAMMAFVSVGSAPVATVAAPAAASAPAPPSAPPPHVAADAIPAPTWSGAKKARRASDGSKAIDFHLAATRDVAVWMNKARPALVARCQSRAIEAFVILDTSASFETDADRRTVRVQWDDEPATVQQWAVSESGKELFVPDAKAFIARMARAQRLQFGFTPFNAEPVTAEFVVAGFDQLAGLVTGTCK